MAGKASDLYKRNRNKNVAFGRKRDFRVDNLYDMCKVLNRDARHNGWAEKYEKYNVDHIVELCNGGDTSWDNIWIVPAEWNQLRAIKTPAVIAAIKSYISRHGRIALKMPKSVLFIEEREAMRLCRERGIYK